MKVKASFTTRSQDFPAQQAIGAYYQVSLVETTTGYTVNGAFPYNSTEFVLDGVPAGTYKGKVTLMSLANTELAPGVEDPDLVVVVEQSTVTLQVPAALTLQALPS